MKRLAIFDLDGTLAATTAVDEECYVRAFREELGCDLDTDWSAYEHCTDWGIAREALAGHFGRPPGADDLAPVRRRFRALLEARLAKEPHAFREVRGAGRLLHHLAERGWRVAIATGGWGVSAELKRRAAGLPTEIPIVSSDHHWTREAIVRAAIERLRPAAGTDDGSGADDERIVSVGDGVWDVRTAARLGLPFVGVADAERAQRLRTTGAHTVLPHFADLPATLDALETARRPETG
jgi:phosphoglycolate phosphatase-like HAD superfamily hydrolase